MPENKAQEVLNRILGDLKSDDPINQLSAIRELEQTGYSSLAIVGRLEELAIRGEGAAQNFALEALKLVTSQQVASRRLEISKPSRLLILREIDSWQASGLLERFRAEALRRRYDFDIQAGKEIAEPKPEQKIEAKESAAVEMPKPVAQPRPAEPRLSLMQTLLSEASVRIYLFLGAFFVIAAAAILAALVESARLPVLLVTTLAFAIAAVGFEKRLPQPSFAFAIVFSFLLPIDAGVIADQFQFAGQSLHGYWAFVFVGMSVVWAISTWFYQSRLFSLASLLAFALGGMNIVSAFAGSSDWIITAIGISAFVGLIGTYFLKEWKGQNFSTPIFVASLAMQGVTVLGSLSLVLTNLFQPNLPADTWMAHTTTWIFAAAFFVVSETIVSFILFPWFSAAALLLLPWLFLSIIDASTITIGAGFAVWGAVTAFGSEVARRIKSAFANKFHLPFLALSVPLLSTAIILGLVERVEYGFTAFFITTSVYALLQVMRPRWYVWTVALLAGLGAYFVFFALPFMEKANVYIGFQLLLASVVLLLPELFFKRPLTLARSWNWPPVALGIVVAAFNILIAHMHTIGSNHLVGNAAVILGVYALLAAGYALRFKLPLPGYFASSFIALALAYALAYFDLDLWLPLLAALSAIYYLAGFALARYEKLKAWGAMLIHSGLGLGTLISLAALVLLKAGGGWYALIVGLLFVAEAVSTRNGRVEAGMYIPVSIASFLILRDLNVREFSYNLLALSFVWLGGDAVFQRVFKERKFSVSVKFVGGCIAALTSMSLLFAPHVEAAICFGAYTFFFAGYALAHRQPFLGFASTASLPLTFYFGLRAIEQTWWLFPLIVLAVAYYLIGLLTHRADGNTWSSLFVFSGLGLGTFLALIAPFQHGGAENALPIALAATLFAAEAFSRRNVWLAFPANGLYLISYFTLLVKLNVDEPQYFSIGAALLGMIMHYLLVRAKSKTGAFIMGVGSQLALLGTTYLQMNSTGLLGFFLVLFAQSLVVLVYGIIMRSRSLVIAPIGFSVLATLTVLYSAMKGLSVALIVGVTGITLLALGVVAVLMREQITLLAERFGEWNA